MPAPRKQKQNKKRRSKPEQVSLALKHLGIISERCLRYWRSLPPEAHSYVSPEDMISEVALHVFSVEKTYDPKIAKESTWVHHVANNKCLSIVSHYKTRQFTSCLTLELTPEVASRIPSPSHGLALREAIDGVEKIIATGSDVLLDFLSAVFRGRKQEIKIIPAFELREAARRHSVTLDDFLMVMQVIE